MFILIGADREMDCSKEPCVDEIVYAIMWRLGVLPTDSSEYEHMWNQVERMEKYSKTILDISHAIAVQVQRGLVYSSLSSNKRTPEMNENILLWDKFKTIVAKDAALEDMLKMKIHECVKENLDLLTTINQPINDSEFKNSESKLSSVDTNSKISKWQELPIVEGLEKHTDFATKECLTTDGMNIVGARVRGKKHKHEGTNCDDWFEFDNAGHWTIIAVADGAGSRKLSRIGSKASCQAAVEFLKDKLGEYKLVDRQQWTPQDFDRDPANGAFLQEDIDYIQTSLHGAMEHAYNAIIKATEERIDKPEYQELLDRNIEVSDLAGTLLLAVCVPAKQGEDDRNLIMTCQIGDGITGAIRKDGLLQVLGLADSGEFSGETEFLTSYPKMKDSLWHKTFGFFGPLQSLMVMTDGVSDDYFPNHPGLFRLYADLALNGIIDLPISLADKIKPSLQTLELKIDTLEALEENEKFLYTVPRPEGDVFVKHAGKLASEYGITEEQLVLNPELIVAGAKGQAICREESPSERLRVWLDSYEVRGSFDDRTLVVVFPKEV